MKTPITYYGGKLNMLKHIIPLIPEHEIYVEPFFGGGAVFFAKEPASSEIINDTNNMVVNFYKVLKMYPDDLKRKVNATLFSRATYKVADTIYRMPHLFGKVQQAWAFYVATNMGFAAKIGSWGYDKYGKRVKAFVNKRMSFDQRFSERLRNVQIENNDACSVITSRDADDAFHYCDPPYIDTNQGHYGGYSQQQYINLLDTLSQVKGKFLLSSYPSEVLDKYISSQGWYSIRFEQPLSAKKPKDGEKRSKKIEVLTANYPISTEN